MKHTPTPWFVQTGCVYSEVSPDTDPSSIRVALMDREEVATSPVERDANAAFIVQAANSHDAFLAVLNQIIEDVEDCHRTGDLENFYERMVANQEDAQQAIGKEVTK